MNCFGFGWLNNPLLLKTTAASHNAIVEGIDVEFHGEEGVIRGEQVRIIDVDDPEGNDLP
jgi:type I restriction enzyme R subunit